MAEPANDYKRKFLVIVDDSKESARAASFAAHRVRRTGGTVVLLAIIETEDFSQFLGVEDVMRAEAREAAEKVLDARQARMADIGGIRSETLIREGHPREVIEQVIAEDPAIAILVLAASASKDGPGPLDRQSACGGHHHPGRDE